MKNIKTLLVLFAPFSLVGCTSVTIDSLPVSSVGTVYNYGEQANTISLVLAEASAASWSKNVNASMFVLPDQMKGKEITKVEKVSDKLLNLTFEKNATDGSGANKNCSITIDTKAFSGAKVKNSFAEIDYRKTGLYASSMLSGSKYLGYSGNIIGCSSQEYGESHVYSGNISTMNPNGFIDDGSGNYGKVRIETFDDNTFTYEIYNYTLDTTKEKFSFTIPYSPLSQVFKGIKNVNLKMSFVKYGDMFRAEDFFGNQYFVTAEQ